MGKDHPPLVIEFFGPPGVGKSAIASPLYETYLTDEFVTEQPTYRLSHENGRMQSHMYKAPQVARELISQRATLPEGDIFNYPLGTIRASYNWLFVTRLLKREPMPEVTILDQGIVQAAWSFAYMAGNEDYDSLVINGLEQLPTNRIHIIVNVQAPVDIIAERLRERDGGGEPGELSTEWPHLRAAMKMCESLADVVQSVTAKQERVHFLTLENDDSETPSNRARELRQKIDERQLN